MSKKPKSPQAENVNGISERDGFQTPNYATELLVPFIPKKTVRIWECAAGLRKISGRLNRFGYDVMSTDLAWMKKFNFFTYEPDFWFDVIITNPPFSLKKKFFLKCLEYKSPFALLIPADYSGWTIEAVDKYGCEKIIPTRRIDYITPNTLKRIWFGETWEIVKREWDLDSPLIDREMFIDSQPMEWNQYLVENERFHFKSIYDAPSSLLRKYSSSYYHSMWLTWGFNIGRTETFVELTNEQKNNI